MRMVRGRENAYEYMADYWRYTDNITMRGECYTCYAAEAHIKRANGSYRRRFLL